jgi:hypothetical protein
VFRDRLRLVNSHEGRREAVQGNRRLNRQLGCGNRDRPVADVAGLAMLLVEELPMPMQQGMKTQRAHGENEQKRKQPISSSPRHISLANRSPDFEDSWMRVGKQQSL